MNYFLLHFANILACEQHFSHRDEKELPSRYRNAYIAIVQSRHRDQKKSE